MGDWDFEEIIRFVFIGFVVLAWIGGQVVRVFLRAGNEQRRRAMAGRPALPRPPRPKPAEDMGSFMEELRRHSEEQERRFQRQTSGAEPEIEEFGEDLAWEPVPGEPPPPPMRDRAKIEIDRTRLPRFPAARGRTLQETSASDPTVSNVYAAPAHFSLPSWLSVSDITHGKHKGTILGLSPQRAILLSEIIGPPLARRGHRRGPPRPS